MTDNLSERQVKALAVIRDNEGISSAKIASRFKITDNAASKLCKRLNDRELILGAHAGWRISNAGRELADELAPASRVNSDATGRTYVVLEELTLADLIARVDEVWPNGDKVLESDMKVYVVVNTVDGRNTEHAFRQTAKEVFGPRADGDVTVPAVAVDAKRWQVTPVRVRTTQTVAVG